MRTQRITQEQLNRAMLRNHKEKDWRSFFARSAKMSPSVIFGGFALALVGVVYAVPTLAPVSYDSSAPPPSEEAAQKNGTAPVRTAGHVETPEPLYGIYMSQCVVGTRSFRDSLVTLIDETALNAVVIDIKDYTGTLGFTPKDPRFADIAVTKCGAADMEEFIKTLHEKGVYVIGRITVFQDPTYTKAHPDQAVQSASHPGTPWKDHKGLAFVDVSSRPFWEYIAALAKESYAIGFDELNFDYIRYPSDGHMQDAVYQNPNRAEAVERFWKYLHAEMQPLGVVTSADLFGMAATNTDDLGIGQVLERAMPYFDYIMPMVYPSHYPKGYNGYGNPNDYPYEIIQSAMSRAAERAVAAETSVQTLDGKAIMRTESYVPSGGGATTTREVASGMYTKAVYPKTMMRPWLQDFDYGKDYLLADIRAQIQGTYDAGLTSWIFWDPGNKYSSLRQFLAE